MRIIQAWINGAIWRDPLDILASLIRNDFIDDWYLDAFDEVAEAVAKEPELNWIIGDFIETLSTKEERTAFIISARSWYLFRYIDKGNIIRFEDFVSGESLALDRFLDFYGLAPQDISSNRDKNIVGLTYQPDASHRDVIDQALIPNIEKMFDPLRNLIV